MMPPPASLLLASVMKSLISSPKALPGQNKLLRGRKVCLRISELDVTCILGLAGFKPFAQSMLNFNCYSLSPITTPT